jgi:hypothetical protein
VEITALVRTCEKCHLEKQLERDFYRDASRAGGRMYKCKSCCGIRKRQRYLEAEGAERERLLHRQRLSAIRSYHRRHGRGVASRYPGMVELARGRQA